MIIDNQDRLALVDEEDSSLRASTSYLEKLPDYVEARRMPQPPTYTEHSRPKQPITYTFTDWASDSMMLLPPQIAADISPIYHISVTLNLNPFLPISYVTSIRRGGTVQGPSVGEFEMSLNQGRQILTIGDVTTRLVNVLSRINDSARHWAWSCGDIHLRWDCRNVLDDGSPMCICFARDGAATQLASFVPPPMNASPPLPAATLTVFPDGHGCFDHILISALIVERKRTLDY